MLFAIFGLGALILAGVVIPLARLRSRAEPYDLLSQRIIHSSFRFFIGFGERLGLLGLDISGAELLQQPGHLVVANHPTLLDAVYLIAHMPQADCVVKKEVWSNPLLRHIAKAAGYIPNQGGEAVVEACASRLRAGRSVVLFPEGSRSPVSGLRGFNRGAAHVALESGAPITPVAISCDPPALKKGQRWYHLPDQRLVFSLRVGREVYAKDLCEQGLARAISVRQVTAALESYFEERLEHGSA
ncbi:MAG: lysophospholipid acyltransferase family protein [Myxococcota bacterium]|nr:lysophospholipid acyltransferase family protein [Myxococcota bacterium]